MKQQNELHEAVVSPVEQEVDKTANDCKGISRTLFIFKIVMTYSNE